MRRRPITQHVPPIEQIAIVLPDILARRAVNVAGHVLPELRLGRKGEHEREEGDA